MNRHIIFDLDGTLVDSLPGLAEAVNRSRAQLGFPPLLPEQVRNMIGRGAKNLCAQALGYADADSAPAPQLEAMHSLFCNIYPQCRSGGRTRVYPGIHRMLRQLAAAGTRLAVLSNKPHDVTLPMVRELFADIPFQPVLGLTDEFPGKPAPDALLYIAALWGVPAAEITLVGDSLVDAATAARAGCRFQAVAWGYAGTAASYIQTTAHPAHSAAELSAALTTGPRDSSDGGCT